MATVAAAVDAKQEYKIIMVLGFKASSNFVDTDITYSPQYEIQSGGVFEINLLNTENRAKIHNTITIDFYYCEKNPASDEKQSESYSNRPRNYKGHLQIKRGGIIFLEDTSTGGMNKIDDQHKHKVASSQFHFPKIFKTAEIIFAAAEDHRQAFLKVNPRTSLLGSRVRARSDADAAYTPSSYPAFNYSLLPASDSSAALVASGTNPSINSADAKAGTNTDSSCHWCRCM